MGRPPSDAPSRILTAAAALLAEQGATALSFDRVAQRTGLSKGGVLHHFRSRQALVRALVAWVVDDLDARIHGRIAADNGPAPTRAARAYVTEVLLDVDHRAGRPIIAAIALDPALLAPLWAHRRAWRTRLESDLGVDAVLVQSAVDSLWLGALLAEPALDSTARTQLRSRLFAIIGRS